MNIKPTLLEGCVIIEPRVFGDDRGYFFESFSQKNFFEQTGNNTVFVQDNESYSTKGVLRGLHFQKGEAAQTKLVRVVKGEVLDVCVDLRKNSPTYGQYIGVNLSENNKLQLLIPRGFAHGFVVLSDEAVFQYKCDSYYNKEAEGGIHYADYQLAIDWLLPLDELIVSQKDMELPVLADAGELGF